MPGFAVAEDQYREHVDAVAIEFAQRHDANVLRLAPEVAGDDDGAGRRPFAAQNFERPVERCAALAARRVVKCNDEIRVGRRFEPPLDVGQGRQKFRDRDGAEVVPERALGVDRVGERSRRFEPVEELRDVRSELTIVGDRVVHTGSAYAGLT